jgi:hypothetical protein
MDVAIEVIGWTGTALVVAAYLLASRGVWATSGPQAATMNVLGGLLLIINGASHGALPSVGLNLVWMAVAAATLVRFARRRGTLTA